MFQHSFPALWSSQFPQHPLGAAGVLRGAGESFGARQRQPGVCVEEAVPREGFGAEQSPESPAVVEGA